jgi:hypothetical protein
VRRRLKLALAVLNEKEAKLIHKMKPAFLLILFLNILISHNFIYAKDSVYVAWVRHSAGLDSIGDLRAISIDQVGNVYVTGFVSTTGTMDYITIKYNYEGNYQWSSKYDGPGISNDAAQDIAVDRNGNVYVTGLTKKSSVWGEITTIKYDSSGIEQWVANYIGPTPVGERVKRIVLDSLNNIYIVGSSKGVNSYHDFLTIKYNSDGIEQWVARYNGPANTDDEAIDIVIDKFGDICVTGFSYGDFVTIKYNSSGVEKWIARYNGPISHLALGNAIGVDSFGNIIISGHRYIQHDSLTITKFHTIKYDTSGNVLWNKIYYGDTLTYYDAVDLSIDNMNNIYILGAGNPPNTSDNFTTVKYNSVGVEEWSVNYDGPLNRYDFPRALSVDDSGNVFVIGDSEGLVGGYDFATVKYDRYGVNKWVARYDGPGNYHDIPSNIFVDKTGNVYAIGNSRLSPYNYLSVFTTIKYTQTPPTSIREIHSNIASNYWLAQNYPNPFNPATEIRYSIPQSQKVTIKVYNILAQTTRILISEYQSVGDHRVVWDGRDESKHEVSSGIYFYQLQAGDFIETKKMILMR